jgi:hypothetical protein
MDTSGVQTLKVMVKTIIFESGYTQEHWPYVYQFTIDAIRDVHMFHTSKYKISKVDMDTQTNTISWPDDYLGLCFLAIPQNGQIWTLTRDNKIIPTTTLVNGQETLDSNSGEGVIESEGIVWGYAAKGGQNTLYYTEDENNRRFFINGIKPVTDILMGYISSGIEDKDTLIPIRFKNVAEMYVRWKMNLRDPVNKNDADYFKDLYEQESNKLVAFEDPTLDEIYDALLKVSTQVVNR